MADTTADATTLGALAVAIGGDLNPLVSVLEDARRRVEAFDRDMANRSGGLIQFVQRTNDAGTAIDSQTTKTGKAASTASDAAVQVNKLSDANDRAARSSKAVSDATETEAQKNERLAATIDRAMERMQARDNLRMRSGSLPGIESGGIPADYVARKGVQDAMMGTVGGRIPADVLSGAEGAAAGAGASKIIEDLKGTTKGLEQTGEAMEELGGKTHITSQAMREFITIPREIASGNWSRVPGSVSILAQQMGLLNSSTLPVIGAFGLAAVAVAAFGIAAVQSSRESRELTTELDLAGGKAGLTADTLIAASKTIAESTDTSVSSTRKLMEQLAVTNDFTKNQIIALVTAAQALSKATGDSAEDIIKDFEKMSASPTKYAEAYQHAHVGVITPTIMNHIRDLERQGDKEQALGVLVNAVTDDIAQHTKQQMGFIEGLWDGFLTHVKNAWQSFKDMISDIEGNTADSEMLKRVNENLAEWRAHSTADDPIAKREISRLENEQRVLQARVAAQAADTKARADSAQAADRQAAAIKKVNDQLLRGIDSPNRYHSDLTDLHNTLADAVGLARTATQAQIVAAGLKSADNGVRDLASHYDEAATRIKKSDMSVQFKADTKAANAAAAAARRLEREAAALEKRRQEEITSLREQSSSLEAILPLYENQSATLDDVNRAKAITTALTKEKLTAEDAEGRTIAALAGHVYDLTAAIDAETEARRARDEFEKHIAGVRAQAGAVGDERDPADASAESAAYGALDKSQRRKRDLAQNDRDAGLISEQQYQDRLTEIAREGSVAREKLDQMSSDARDARQSLDANKFFQSMDQQIAKIRTETATMGQAEKTEDEATIRLRLMTDAKKAHVEMTDENIRKINAEAHALAGANAEYTKAQRLNQYGPQHYAVTGSDYHALDQSLGGRFKQQDDLKVLQDDIAKREKILAQMHADGLINERGYQDRLTQIHADGEAARRKILLATASVQIQAGQEIADAMASMAADMFGKQSSAYRALFDLSKGFAIAQAALAMYQDIAQAMAKGFPQNIPLIAQAAAEGAMIISDIKSIALTFSGGGYVAGPGGPTSDSIPAWLSNGEFVMNAAMTAQWRPVLESMNAGRMPALPTFSNDNGGGRLSVVVHNHARGVDHEIRQISPGEVEIIAKRVVRSDAPKVIATDIQRPNSPTNKALTRTTTARPRRAG